MSNVKYYDEQCWKGALPGQPSQDSFPRLKLLLRFLPQFENVTKILDAGCGAGFFSQRLAHKGYQIVGIDISQNAVLAAQEACPSGKFICQALDTPWALMDYAFDAIWSTEVIEHVYDVRQMFIEAHRVLKPGGYFILTTPYHGVIKNLLITLFKFEHHFNIVGGHIRFFTNRSLTRLLSECGFDVIAIDYIGRLPPIAKSVFVVARKRLNND